MNREAEAAVKEESSRVTVSKERVIEILKYYKEIGGEIKIQKKIVNDLNEQYYDPIKASDNRGMAGAIIKRTEDVAMEIPNEIRGEIREYEERIRELRELKTKILREVSRLNLKEKSIIFDFYINGLKWKQVAERNGYSERQCKNIRDAAVEKLAKYFGNSNTILRFKMER